MNVSFAISAKSFSLYESIKKEAEKMGWTYYNKFNPFDESKMKTNSCLYFCTHWTTNDNPDFLFAFSNASKHKKIFHLPKDWDEAVNYIKENSIYRDKEITYPIIEVSMLEIAKWKGVHVSDIRIKYE